MPHSSPLPHPGSLLSLYCVCMRPCGGAMHLKGGVRVLHHITTRRTRKRWGPVLLFQVWGEFVTAVLGEGGMGEGREGFAERNAFPTDNTQEGSMTHSHTHTILTISTNTGTPATHHAARGAASTATVFLPAPANHRAWNTKMSKPATQHLHHHQPCFHLDPHPRRPEYAADRIGRCDSACHFGGSGGGVATTAKGHHGDNAGASPPRRAGG